MHLQRPPSPPVPAGRRPLSDGARTHGFVPAPGGPDADEFSPPADGRARDTTNAAVCESITGVLCSCGTVVINFCATTVLVTCGSGCFFCCCCCVDAKEEEEDDAVVLMVTVRRESFFSRSSRCVL